MSTYRYTVTILAKTRLRCDHFIKPEDPKVAVTVGAELSKSLLILSITLQEDRRHKIQAIDSYSKYVVRKKPEQSIRVHPRFIMKYM